MALDPDEIAGGAEPIVVFGACVSTLNERVAGEASVLPAASVARTDALCAPSLRAGVVQGLVQLAHAPVSTRHRNVEPASVAVKANVGVASLVAEFGPEPIVVSGAVVSGGGAVPTVNERVAGDASALPAGSVARTDTLCAPSARAAVVHGLVHVAHDPESTRHWNVDPPRSR